jgi:hypothetical protein
MGPIRRILTWGREGVAWSAAIWHVLGWLGLASIVSGVAVSVGGTVWAVLIGVPLPIALMAGYCTFVGAVCLTLAPIAFRALAKRSIPATSKKDDDLPNYEAWKHVDRFTINQAAHLWCDIDPNLQDTLDTTAWAIGLSSAVKKGELKYEMLSGSLMVTREALKAFAKAHGYDPRFLRD